MTIKSLKDKFEFDRVFNEGSRVSGRYLTAVIRRTKAGPVRIGIAASGKYGNAVERNRVKRLIREAFKTVLADINRPFEVVVIPKTNAKGVLMSSIYLDMNSLLGKAGVI